MKFLRPALIAISTALYEPERKIIDEKTEANMVRARVAGKHFGGQKLAEDLKHVKGLLSLEVLEKRIAELLRASETTLYRYLKHLVIRRRITN